MIAIVGSKGGCGKTTTTLGLAGAFARAETPALAIDADRQLPDLHTIAGVDRAPTVASLDGSEDVGSVAQPIPEWPGVSVLPGPKPAESADIERTLSHMDSVAAEVVVDCPSGAGPDVTDPLSAADRAVVVTTERSESIKDARTSIDLANRLDVPVAGVVVTMCSAAPDSITSELDVPVLATVPESDSPLTDDETLGAYDRAVANLQATATSGARDDVDPAVQAGARVPLGFEALDQTLGGGVPPGSLLAVVAHPVSQSEHLLHQAAATRGTLYVSTDRPEMLVRAAIETDTSDPNSPAVRQLSTADPIEEMHELLPEIPEGTTVIVDAADPLEASDRDAYAALLETLKQRLVETDSIALLHCLDQSTQPAHRHLTQRVADGVVVVDSDPSGQLDDRLSITKYRPDRRVCGSVASSRDTDQ